MAIKFNKVLDNTAARWYNVFAEVRKWVTSNMLETTCFQFFQLKRLDNETKRWYNAFVEVRK